MENFSSNLSNNNSKSINNNSKSSSREFDIIIFGASGFTGKFVVFSVARICKSLKWTVAGRNSEKLKQISNILDLSMKNQLRIVLADVNDFDSLIKMTERTKLLLNVVGPYRKYGESVVKACIKTSTSLVDICGEPEFLEKMQLQYHQQALDSGCLFVQSCGFDSIPADLGLIKLEQQFYPNGLLIKAESFLTLLTGEEGVGCHFTTFEAAVLGVGSSDELRKLRQHNSVEKPKLNFVGPKLEVKRGPFADERVPSNRACYLFMGADASVMKRTQEQLTKDNPMHYSPHFGVYFTVQDGMADKIRMAFYGGMFQFLSRYQFGRRLLLNHSELFTYGIFTRTGPSEKQIRETRFEMKMFGIGYKDASILKDNCCLKNGPIPPTDRSVTLVVAGPEPGYAATSAFVACAALSIIESLEAKDNSLPNAGIFTPGYAFRNCSKFIENLKKEGISFTIKES